MKKSILLSRLFVLILLAGIVSSCEEGVTPNVTPTGTLNFYVTDTNQDAVEGATVYLFPFKSVYDAYLADNPDGTDQPTPDLPADQIGITDASGLATFPNFQLEGNSFASGDTWVHRPNSIYFRVQFEDGGNALTNDSDIIKISFDELESGDMIEVDQDVVID